MPGFADLACVYLAAGEGRRFGGGKLEAEISGKMMGLHMAERLADLGFSRLLAVSNAANARLNPALAALGFDLLVNPDPAAGQAQSIRLALQALASVETAGILVALADMPFVTAEHLDGLVKAFDGEQPVCSGHDGRRMPPAIFPQRMCPALQRLSGDQGARNLLSGAVLVEANAAMLADIDRPEDLPA